jgi:predicted membrane channel-forming protein YqfA (hemolysin III family)
VISLFTPEEVDFWRDQFESLGMVLAIFGIRFNALGRLKYRRLSTSLYGVMGWIGNVRDPPVLALGAIIFGGTWISLLAEILVPGKVAHGYQEGLLDASGDSCDCFS